MVSPQVVDYSHTDTAMTARVPVHKSAYNPKDSDEVISARVTPKDGPTKTHHIYKDGTGTMKMGILVNEGSGLRR